MRKSISILIFILLCTFAFNGCFEVTAKNKTTSYMYAALFNSYMLVSPDLNDSIKFIAIDADSIKNLNQSDIKTISNELSKTKKVDIMYASLATLKQKGLYNDSQGYLDGVLISIKSVNQTSDSEYSIKGTKFRATGRSVDIASSAIYKDGQWTITTSSQSNSK